MMKKALSLLLVLCLLLPVFAFAEEGDLDIEELYEDVDLDNTEADLDTGDEETAGQNLGAGDVLSEEQKQELAGSLESKDYVPTNLAVDNLYSNISNNVQWYCSSGKTIGDLGLSEEQAVATSTIDLPQFPLINLSPGAGDDEKNAAALALPFKGYEEDVYSSYDEKNIFHDNPERSLATVNYNFEMNIPYYVTINFHGVAAIVDALGGVDVDLTKGEAWNINYYLKKNGKKIARTYDTLAKGEKRQALEVRDGVQHLDGIQALMYARLRKSLSSKYDMGGDWKRTERARHLLDLLLQKVLKMDAMDILDLAGTAIEYVNSNMNIDTILDLILKVLRSGITDKLGSSDTLIEQFRIPMGDAETGDKTWSYDNDSGKIFMSRKNGNFQKNVEALHEFIYGKYYPASNP